MSRFTPLLALLPFALACGSDKQFEAGPPFEKTESVRLWATTASAVSVYSNGYEALAVADGAISYPDPACPTTADDGTTLTVTGGCTDVKDKEWKGSATVRREGSEHRLTARGLNGMTGTMTLRELGPTLHEFEVDLVIGGVTTIEYLGTVEGGYDGPTTWNGSGRVERDGFLPPIGTVEATTTDQVVDDARCSGQPVSGSTSLHSRGDTAVVTYDGATDCDADENALLSVNGEERGLISGISCAVGEIGKNDPAGVVGAALAALMLLAQRRRRR